MDVLSLEPTRRRAGGLVYPSFQDPLLLRPRRRHVRRVLRAGLAQIQVMRAVRHRQPVVARRRIAPATTDKFEQTSTRAIQQTHDSQINRDSQIEKACESYGVRKPPPCQGSSKPLLQMILLTPTPLPSASPVRNDIAGILRRMQPRWRECNPDGPDGSDIVAAYRRTDASAPPCPARTSR